MLMFILIILFLPVFAGEDVAQQEFDMYVACEKHRLFELDKMAENIIDFLEKNDCDPQIIRQFLFDPFDASLDLPQSMKDCLLVSMGNLSYVPYALHREMGCVLNIHITKEELLKLQEAPHQEEQSRLKESICLKILNVRKLDQLTALKNSELEREWNEIRFIDAQSVEEDDDVWPNMLKILKRGQPLEKSVLCAQLRELAECTSKLPSFRSSLEDIGFYFDSVFEAKGAQLNDGFLYGNLFCSNVYGHETYALKEKIEDITLLHGLFSQNIVEQFLNEGGSLDELNTVSGFKKIYEMAIQDVEQHVLRVGGDGNHGLVSYHIFEDFLQRFEPSCAKEVSTFFKNFSKELMKREVCDRERDIYTLTLMHQVFDLLEGRNRQPVTIIQDVNFAELVDNLFTGLKNTEVELTFSASKEGVGDCLLTGRVVGACKQLLNFSCPYDVIFYPQGIYPAVALLWARNQGSGLLGSPLRHNVDLAKLEVHGGSYQGALPIWGHDAEHISLCSLMPANKLFCFDHIVEILELHDMKGATPYIFTFFFALMSNDVGYTDVEVGAYMRHYLKINEAGFEQEREYFGRVYDKNMIKWLKRERFVHNAGFEVTQMSFAKHCESVLCKYFSCSLQGLISNFSIVNRRVTGHFLKCFLAVHDFSEKRQNLQGIIDFLRVEIAESYLIDLKFSLFIVMKDAAFLRANL